MDNNKNFILEENCFDKDKFNKFNINNSCEAAKKPVYSRIPQNSIDCEPNYAGANDENENLINIDIVNSCNHSKIKSLKAEAMGKAADER